MPTSRSVERRLIWLTLGFAAAGSLIAWICFSLRAGMSFAAGAAIGCGNLLWIRFTVDRVFARGGKGSTAPVVAGYLARLMLIPLSLYAMIRFFSVDVIAAVAGLVVLVCSVLAEGILEGFGSNP